MSEGNAWAEYIQNIHKTEELQEEILKGARAGDSPLSLLLRCSKALSLATSCPHFYDQLERTVRAIHGSALCDPAALEIELEQARARLEKIRAAYEQEKEPDLREELRLAIRSHEERIEHLNAQLNA